jgi:hypothetical protein
MSILSARPAAAKFSTLAPTRRERRPYGQGILVAPQATADPWDVEADPADWPADTDADVWSITEPARDADSCWCWTDPAHVRAGSYCPSCLAEKAAAEAPVVHVAASAKPATTPKASGAPKAHEGRRGPAAEDLAFEAGRTAAIEAGHSAVSPVGRLTDAERAAWQAGLDAGLVEVERADDLAAAELQARWDGLFVQDDHDPAERAEAVLSTRPAVAVD